MSSGDTIAIFAIAVPVIVMIVAAIVANLNTKNKELRAKVDAKDAIIDNKDSTITELTRQLDKLEITGVLMNRFFSQLPAPNELKKEIQP
jgi:cell division protein FtsL